jgi:hypothetical protein
MISAERAVVRGPRRLLDARQDGTGVKDDPVVAKLTYE